MAGGCGVDPIKRPIALRDAAAWPAGLVFVPALAGLRAGAVCWPILPPRGV